MILLYEQADKNIFKTIVRFISIYRILTIATDSIPAIIAEFSICGDCQTICALNTDRFVFVLLSQEE
jgi:epoxyqueuosine reductase QueG